MNGIVSTGSSACHYSIIVGLHEVHGKDLLTKKCSGSTCGNDHQLRKPHDTYTPTSLIMTLYYTTCTARPPNLCYHKRFNKHIYMVPPVRMVAFGAGVHVHSLHTCAMGY